MDPRPSLLTELLDRNAAHVKGGADDSLKAVADGQRPPVVSVCCSDSRVSQEGMFGVSGPGWLFTPSTIGNQVWDVVDGERVVDGSVLYPLVETGTRTVAVVGHTGCGAVTAALKAHRGEAGDLPAGIAKRVGLLAPVVASALDDGTVDPARGEAALVDQLVEVNVCAQARFLKESPDVPPDAAVYGFVYDLTGAYGGPRGRTYLVWADGTTDPDELSAMAGGGHRDAIESLLR